MGECTRAYLHYKMKLTERYLEHYDETLAISEKAVEQRTKELETQVEILRAQLNQNTITRLDTAALVDELIEVKRIQDLILEKIKVSRLGKRLEEK